MTNKNPFAVALGALGGRTKGPSKRRSRRVLRRAQRASVAARKANKLASFHAQSVEIW